MVRPSGFPAALRLAGLLVVRAVGFPGGAAPGRATDGGACGIPGGAALGRATDGAAFGIPGGAAPGRATGGAGCGVSRRRCAWPGYWLVVRPVGWVARARHLCRPREGRRCHMRKKSPYFRTGSYLEYGGEGGIDSLRSPLLGPSMGLAPSGPTPALFKNAPGVFVGAARLLRSRSVQLAAPVVEPRSGVLVPPPTENIKEKSPYFRTSSHLEYGGEGGIDSLRSPLRGSPLTAFAVCPTGCASCRTPVGGSHPPQRRI